jgi:hypothetical protein
MHFAKNLPILQLFVQIGLLSTSGLLCFCPLSHRIHADDAKKAAPPNVQKDDLASEGNLSSQVKVVVEVKGWLFTEPEHATAADKRIPIKAIANLAYHETILGKLGERRSIRQYQDAHSEIAVANRPRTVKLRDARKIVQFELNSTPTTVFSTQGPLSRDELDVLTVPFNSALVDLLLPEVEVKPGSTWQHEGPVMAKLMNLDAVTSCDATSRLVAIDGTLVRMEMIGKIGGSVDGVVSDVELAAKYTYDQKLDRITWVAVSIKEQRSVGATTPGFEVEARVRTVIGELPLTDLSNLQVDDAQQPGHRVLEYQFSGSNYVLTHDRRWYVVSEFPNRSILRMVELGDTLAQCNLRVLPIDAKIHTLTLDQFQADVGKALNNASAHIISAEESVNPAGLRILRVQLAGEVNGAPVQWIYYLASDETGRGLTYVFTMAESAVDRFGATDIELTDSLRFIDAPESSAKTASLPLNEPIR